MAKVLLVVYDNDSYIHFFPQGPAYLISVLEKEGHEVMPYCQDTSHATEEDLLAHLENVNYDIIGLGFTAGYYQYRKACKIAAVVNKARKKHKNIKFILGGHGPAAAPIFFLDKLEADAVFVGESLHTLPEWINSDQKERVVTCKNLINADDLPLPAYHAFPLDIYRLIRWPTSQNTDFCMPILSGMGCLWKCSFCYRMDKGFRPRSAESVIDEISRLWKYARINHFQFSDELFMSSEARAQEFCEKLLESDSVRSIRNFKWDCNGRLNFAKPATLNLMKRAGCEYVNYGIESVDENVLRNINKGLTINQIVTGIENTLKEGLSPGINFMWGNIGDTPESLEKAADFIIKYNPGHELRTIRPVTPYPGSPLFDEAIKRGLIEDVEDFYEYKHVNSDLFSCNFMDIDTEEAHNLLYKANLRIMKHHYEARRMKQNAEAFNCYMGMNNNFRGFRNV